VPKLQISHCRKKSRFLKKNQTFAISPVVFAPRSQTYAAELKEYGMASS
jgi:hypothetical protein